MSADQALIEALQKVVELDPKNVSVRLQLAELLLKNGQAPQALSQAQVLLAEAPDQSSALNVAAQACEAMEEFGKARAYRRMCDALAERLIGEEIPAEPAPEKPTESEEMWQIAPSSLRLDDVAGLEKAKSRLQLSFLGPMRNAELREAFGNTGRGGLLLYGPPGCGKTFLAKAIAGELQAGFLNVSVTDVKDPFFGNSERRLRFAFESARQQAPCVLFFDEMDALAGKRIDLKGQMGRGLVNQLLTEMDGVDSRNDGVYILAATNHPWDIDTAIRRPGRIDRILFVPPPDTGARAMIATRCFSNIPNKGVDFDWIAGHTDGYSGADVALLCQSAAELALEESMRSGKVCPVEHRHVKAASKDVRSSMRSWLETAKNYALFSNDGGEYDELLDYLKARRMV